MGTWPPSNHQDVTDAVNQLRAITAVSVKDYGAVGNGTTNDTTAIVNATAAALSAKKSLYIPAGTYKVTSAVDWRKEGLHAFGDGIGISIIQQSGTNMPVVMLGEQYQHIHDLSFFYAAQAALTDTNSVGMRLYKPFFCVYERLSVFWTYQGVAVYPGGYASLTDTDPTTNYEFSNSFRDIRIAGYRQNGINTTPTLAANTGSVWQNIYVHNGPVGPLEVSNSYPVYIEGCDEQQFHQINVEGAICNNSDIVFVHASNVVINGLHVEGCTVNAWDGSVLQCYDKGNTLINMMTVQGTTFASGQNNKSVLKVGLNAKLRVQGLSMQNANVYNSAVMGLMQSIDQTGQLWVTEADLTHFTVRTIGDTGTTKVTRQVNEMTNFTTLAYP